MPSIAQPVSYLKTIDVPTPPLPEQHAIVAILGALDDKIELNRQMNKTLEEMAQALFKSWFVDFEPFRDKGMQDSLLGEIPVGWKCATAADSIEINPSRRLSRGADATEGSRGETGIPQEEAVAIMLEKYEVVSDMFHGFDQSRFFTGTPTERISIIPAAIEHILVQPNGKERLLQAVTELSKAFALAVPHEKAREITDEVGFFQVVRSAIAKNTRIPGKTQEELDTAIRQIVSKAISSDEVIDIFSATGLKKPDISILSDEFLAEVQKMPHRNLALELLHKLLNDEIKSRSRKHLVQSRSFAEMLEKTIRRYQNRTIEATQVILELIELAKQMREARSRGEKLGLIEDEEAFYDALEVNDSAVKVLGDEVLKTLARELVETVRRNATIDWTVRESARAKLRTMVRRLLRKYGYPPDKQEKATLTVLEQAELLGRDWAGS